MSRLTSSSNMMQWCESTRSKVILGNTLTIQTASKSSTDALGNVHNEVRHELTASDAVQLARHMLYSLLKLNGYSDIIPRRMCHFEFNTRQLRDMKRNSEIQNLLVRSDVPAPVAMQTMLTPLVTALQQGQEPDAMTAMLAEAWPHIDDQVLRQLIARSFFVANIRGGSMSVDLSYTVTLTQFQDEVLPLLARKQGLAEQRALPDGELESKKLLPYRLEIIFRTNTQSA